VPEVIFIDESIRTDIENRARVNTDVIPRLNDWVIVPGEAHVHLRYHVALVCIDFTVDPPEVRVSLDEHRAR
jgi:hypothetical protein